MKIQEAILEVLSPVNLAEYYREHGGWVGYERTQEAVYERLTSRAGRRYATRDRSFAASFSRAIRNLEATGRIEVRYSDPLWSRDAYRAAFRLNTEAIVNSDLC